MAILSKIPADEDNKALILYENKLSAASSSAASVALIPSTAERWTSASGTMQATFQPGSATTINCICIGAHNLGSAGSTIVIETAPTVAGSWTVRGAISPSNNRALMFTFDDVEAADVRITITGGTDREVAVIYAGEFLRMQQPVYGGQKSPLQQRKVKYDTSDSEGGEWLGRNVIRQGVESSLRWNFIDPYWYRENFDPFIQAAETAPFFIKWRPDKFPDEVLFCRTVGDTSPDNIGQGSNKMVVVLNFKGYA